MIERSDSFSAILRTNFFIVDFCSQFTSFLLSIKIVKRATQDIIFSVPSEKNQATNGKENPSVTVMTNYCMLQSTVKVPFVADAKLRAGCRFIIWPKIDVVFLCPNLNA